MPESSVFAADEVARKEFATSFRGYDHHEVRAFLGRLAAELASLQTRERTLEDRLAAAERKAAPRDIGAEELERALGSETAKVLQAARAAAAEIRTRAEEQVARLLREAGDEASRLREEAGTVLAERTADAERRAAAILAAADRDAGGRRAAAEAAAAAAVEASRQQGRRLVGEAESARERILGDLARRRRIAQQELEQLRAGRDRMLEGCRAVQAALDAAVGELHRAEPEARAASEQAALRAASEPEMTAEELELEVAAAERDRLDDVPPAVPAAEPGGPAAAEPADATAEAVAEPAAPPPAPARAATPATTVAELAEAAGEPSGGRRRRKRVPPTVELVALEDESELVRVLPGERPVARPPTAAVPSVGTRTKSRRSSSPGTRAPAPTSPPPAAPAPPAVVAPAPVVEPEPEPEAAAPSGPPSEPEPEPQAAGPTEEDESATAPPRPPVDDLFARLRDQRAATVARATEVLAAAPAPARAPEPTAAAAAPEPVEEWDVGVDEAPDDGAVDPATAAVRAFERRDAAVEPHERALAKALKRALADEQNRILDELRMAAGAPDPAALLPPVDEHGRRYADAARPALAAVAGPRPRLVADLADVLGREVVAGLRPRLERALERAGDGGTAATDALSAAYREEKTARVEGLARHHVLVAWAARAAEGAGDGHLVWVVDPDEGCSPDCADNALAGPTPRGEPFPTGHLHPPAHPGCRCLVLPAGL